MQSKLICEEFERKMWQFMDRDLPDEEIVFWEEHLRNCALCSSGLQEAGEALSIYESIPMEDLEEETFARMVNKAVKKNRFHRAVSKLPDYFHELSFPGPVKKFAFGGIAFSAVVVILFFMYKPENLNTGKELSPVQMQNHTLEGNDNGIAENSASALTKGTQEGVTTAPVRKNEVSAVKYEWHDMATASAIRHVGSSISVIRSNERHLKLDDWMLQAIALRRKMQWLTADIDKSAM